MAIQIYVWLPEKRDLPGRMDVYQDGKYQFSTRSLGTSEYHTSWKTIDGNTPSGTYRGTFEAYHADKSAKWVHSYGDKGRIELAPVTGEAKEAETTYKRGGLFIHGGAAGKKFALRPTHGCVRISNTDMARVAKLAEADKSISVTVKDVASPATKAVKR